MRLRQGWVGRSSVPGPPNRTSWEEEEELEEETSGKSNYSHTLRRATNFGTWWLSLACFYIKCRAPSHMILFFFVFTISVCLQIVKLLLLDIACCCKSSPFFQDTPRRYISHTSLPRHCCKSRQSQRILPLEFNTHQHGQRENGRGRGRENPQGPGRKGKLACPASACVVLVHTAPRTSLLDEHPLPRGKTRGETTQARGGINKGETMAAATAAGSKAAAAGSEAGLSAEEFRNVLNRSMGIWMGGCSPGGTDNILRVQDMGLGGFACLLVAFGSPGVGGISGS